MTDVLPNWLMRQADVRAERLALDVAGQQLSFAELDQRVSSLARRLISLGIAPGDRVATMLRNGVTFVELVHAVTRIGAILVPLNTRLTAPEIAWQLADSGAKLLVHDDSSAARASDAVAEVPDLRLVVAGAQGLDRIAPAKAALRETIELAAVHCIMYTSGTTGRPKGVLLTYGNHWWGAIGSALNLGLRDDDRWLTVLPLFHIGGLAILLRSVIYGIPALVHDQFDPGQVNRAIESERVTMISVVSAMLQRMLAERGETAYPPTLRCVLAGGGPVPLSLLEACTRRGVSVVQTYGLTETASQFVTLAPADALRKLGSAGKPLLPNELRIDVDGQFAEPGQVGEIVVRGPTVTLGYLNRPEESRRAIRDGWLHTGDLGYLDDDGYLYVVDRRDDLIISGGENVYPAEVEAVLLSHAAVEEAGVVGSRDDRWGEVPVAFVKLLAGTNATEAELIAYCASRLARFKIPVRVYFLDELPRNAAGKLLRANLREKRPKLSEPR